MRLFTAIDLPVEMVEKLSAFLARLRPLAKLRWTEVENFHITTKFIGEWPEARVDEMKNALRGVENTTAVRISVRGVGWFPDLHRPHVFWAGVDGGEALSNLAKTTEQAAATLGVPLEPRLYSPHLTLARVKYAVPLEALLKSAGDPDFGAFVATSFFLYLSANGKYSKLAEFPLNQ
jgi:RNA 2',3'-cyclic 3'-phosphodiesterase